MALVGNDMIGVTIVENSDPLSVTVTTLDGDGQATAKGNGTTDFFFSGLIEGDNSYQYYWTVNGALSGLPIRSGTGTTTTPTDQLSLPKGVHTIALVAVSDLDGFVVSDSICFEVFNKRPSDAWYASGEGRLVRRPMIFESLII